jgi:hypothetical protein
MCNYSNKTIIVHKHSIHCGGIGDFIRASLSFYSLCKRLNYIYYIDFNENPYLKECFIVQQIPQEINFLPNENLVILDGIYDLNKIQPYLCKMIINKVYYIKTNAIGFESNDNINIIKDEFFNKILKPSIKINMFIDNIYSKYNLKNNNYISVHIRCGDHNMQTNSNHNDNRINLDNETIYTHYINIINKFHEKYGDNLPLIIHSDSIVFKNKLKELNTKYIFLDLDIKHIAENIGTNDEKSFVSTISEFYIISKALKIFLPNIYSGFSHIASIIEGKELLTNYDCCLFHMLNVNNIKNIII